MVLVDLVEFFKVDVAGVLFTIPINKALSSQIFALDLRCLSYILCNFFTERTDLSLHRSIKVASLNSCAGFHAHFGLTEELVIKIGVVCKLALLARLHDFWVICSNRNDLVEGLRCLTELFKLIQ
mgnify:CR=1 FL=1